MGLTLLSLELRLRVAAAAAMGRTSPDLQQAMEAVEGELVFMVDVALEYLGLQDKDMMVVTDHKYRRDTDQAAVPERQAAE